MFEISLIIPTHNKAPFLELTLSGLINQDFKDFEVIVVDDGSADNTKEIVDKFNGRLNINYIYQTNQGRSVAKNTGLKSVTTKYVILIDDDRIPNQCFVSEHLSMLKENPKTVTIGSKYEILSYFSDDMKFSWKHIKCLLANNNSKLERVINKTNLITPEDIMNDFDEVVSLYYIDEPVDNYSEILEKYGKYLDGFHFGWAIATTGNLGFEIGENIEIKFDENFIGWGGEDNDFAYQLYKENYHFIIAEKAINYHQRHVRKGGEMSQLKKNIEYFKKKFPSVETFLFEQVFNRPAGRFSFVDANEIYKSTINNELLRQTYLKLI